MNSGFSSFVEKLQISDTAFAVALLLAVSLFLFIQLRKSKSTANLRGIAGLEKIKELVDAAVESGQPIYLSLGQGALNTSDVVDSTVGLTVLGYIYTRTAGFQSCDITCGDATLFTRVLGRVRDDESGSAGATSRADGIYFCGPDPLVYANGAVQHLGWSQPQVNLFMGRTDSECLYVAGSPAARHVQQGGGAGSPLATALLHITTGDTVIGEEFYAARAYLHRPDDTKSLIIQDWLRYLVLFAVIVGVVLASLGYGR